ncbi:hypothetical protein DFH06DRAFT_1344545 [Mycena polygramma]|nr:hypothetical protein DFH06DRAFT_1344545 [Mycena polygramma]
MSSQFTIEMILLTYIDARTAAFIARPASVVGIASIPRDLAFRDHADRDWLNGQLRTVAVAKQVDLGTHVVDEQTLPSLPLPPSLSGAGAVGECAAVAPRDADASAGVNFVEKDGWIRDVDCVCISDNHWLNTRTSALTYGLRGLVYFNHRLWSLARLASGVFGRTVHEPMTDLISPMSRVVDFAGNILVPGVDDMVGAADAEERDIYEKLDYSIADVEGAMDAQISLNADKSYALGASITAESGVEGRRKGPAQTPEVLAPLWALLAAAYESEPDGWGSL